MFIHWGIYAMPGRHEWVKFREQLTDEQYQPYFAYFDPDLYDPVAWARDAKLAGMKYAVITTKHHDGFCLFDSQLTDYKATNYGQIDIIWFDFSHPDKGRDAWDSARLVQLVRELQPDILINDRLDYPESADFRTPEQFVPKEGITRDGQAVVWEACHTLNGSWGYDRDNLDWKSPRMLVQMLVDSVSKGGNLLLNVGPTGRGEFDPRARGILAEIGEWMRVHARSIYGAVASAQKAPVDCRLTQRGDRLYAHVFNW